MIQEDVLWEGQMEFNVLFIYLFIYLFIGKEGKRDRDRSIHLFHLFMHALVASCMCPEGRWNLQPWRLLATPGQGWNLIGFLFFGFGFFIIDF